MGHLAGLADADSYDPKYAKWRYDDLPILPEHWQMVVGKDQKKQFDILKKLMNAPDVTLSLIHIFEGGADRRLYGGNLEAIQKMGRYSDRYHPECQRPAFQP